MDDEQPWIACKASDDKVSILRRLPFKLMSDPFVGHADVLFVFTLASHNSKAILFITQYQGKERAYWSNCSNARKLS